MKKSDPTSDLIPRTTETEAQPQEYEEVRKNDATIESRRRVTVEQCVSASLL